MGKKQVKISNPKIGMSRARSPYLLEDSVYTFMLNGQSVDESGNKLTLSNEHSNILASKYKSGFKVIGFRNSVIKRKTYFLLTNPDTKVSEIGCIRNKKSFTELQDTIGTNDCDDCIPSMDLPTPLEDVTQTEHQVYETLLEDACNLCLNFNINKPIFFTELKIENVGEVLFIADDLNVPRYIKLDDLGYYKTEEEEICGTPGVPTCLDCNKLRIFSLYNNPTIKNYSRVLGGNLRKGTYEVFFAYCDELGNERTSYVSLVPPISIFDEGNLVFEQVDNNSGTIFSINVELEPLDRRFTHYKVVVAENASQTTDQGVIIYKDKGVSSISDTIIQISDNRGGSITANKVLIPKPAIDSWKGLTASNNYLFGFGIKEKEEVNLQPVFNLMGSLLQWNSSIAKGDLYTVATSNQYKGYNRDEVYPLAIEPISNDGYIYPKFPLIPRPAEGNERDPLIDGEGVVLDTELGYGEPNIDVDSIVNIADSCDDVTRNERWQYYNTASFVNSCDNGSEIETVTQVETIEVKSEVTKDTIPPLPQISSGTVVLQGDDVIGYTNLEDFINDNPDSCGSAPYTNSPLIDICPFLDINVATIGDPDIRPDLYDECSLGDEPIEPIEQEVIVVNVDNEVVTPTPKISDQNSPDFEYIFVRPNPSCEPYLPESTLPLDTFPDNVDTFFSSSYFLRVLEDGLTCEDIPRINRTVREKLFSTYADSPNSAFPVTNLDPLTTTTYSPIPLSHPYFGTERVNVGVQADPDVAFVEMLSNKDTHTNAGVSTLTVGDIGGGIPITTDIIALTPVPTVPASPPDSEDSAYFLSKVHKGALWFRANINNREKFFLEFVKIINNTSTFRYDMSGYGAWKYFNNRYIRYNIFVNKGDIVPTLGGTIELNESHLIEISNARIDSENVDPTGLHLEDSNEGFLYISIELPVAQGEGYGEDIYYEECVNEEPTHIATAVAIPLGGCFSLNTRDEEYSALEVSYDSIETIKEQTYLATCTYEVPILNDCKPLPYRYGKFSYWESTENYPDNKELYDSSLLDISRDDIPVHHQTNFEQYYVTSVGAGGEYTLDGTEANFTCTPIRHYKFPDNTVTPFIYPNRTGGDAEVISYPLGIRIDDDLVDSFLELAVSNNLISRERKDKITGYKVYRGDRQLSKSIISSGLMYDMRTYKDKNQKDVRYSNFPYNMLGEDKLHTSFDGGVIDLGTSNYLFTYHSPESDYYKSDRPTELSIQGYQFGRAFTTVNEVEDHPKWVILGREARKLAKTLAVVETVAEILVNIANSANVFRIQFGLANSVNVAGMIFAILASIAQNVTAIMATVGKRRYEWEKIFRDLGEPRNFAYYSTSYGNYNFIGTLQETEQKLRGVSKKAYLKPGFFTMLDGKTAEPLIINNIDREESLFLSLASNYPLDLSNSNYDNYTNWDNSINRSLSSQVLSSELGCDTNISVETTRSIASPYVAMKVYKPNQYGTIDSVRWLYTGLESNFEHIEEVGEYCNLCLGGDTFITPHSIKRKLPIFKQDAFDLPDLAPFPYGLQKNIGKPKFFIDYEVSSTFEQNDTTFPTLDYTLEADCLTGTGDFYVQPPTKFYLYYYGIPNFYTESTINTNMRNARKEPWNQFYPQNRDYTNLTQEKLVSITRPNSFFYNSVYSYQGTPSHFKTLPPYYSADVFAKQVDNPNSVMYSQQDNSENSISEPWLNYKPNDRHTFPAAYGKLKVLKGIESQQVLGVFENQSVVFNAVDSYVDGITVNNTDLGTGGIFARRPRTFYDTDLGYLGSQSSSLLSNEYGHFIVDPIRGQVFNVNPGAKTGSIKEISKTSNGKPNGMDIWFKEHLPFKILEDFPNFTNIDNPYNGIGITIGWDSKFKRVLLTKKDYIPVQGVLGDMCTDGTLFYDTSAEAIESIIANYVAQGYIYQGIENCHLKFVEAGTMPITTDVYAVFDTTSMQLQDGIDAAAALTSWFGNYQTNNPTFVGNLYVIPHRDERWLKYPQRIYTGVMEVTTVDGWGAVGVIPPNFNTGGWIPPANIVVIPFIDEACKPNWSTNPEESYHSCTLAEGFGGESPQPTPEYIIDYNEFTGTTHTNYTYFRGVTYPIVRDIGTGAVGEAFVLHLVAAMEGTQLTQEEIDNIDTQVDISPLLSSNPYNALGAIKDFDWTGIYDKTSPASEVFNSVIFASELNEVILGEEINGAELLVPAPSVELTDPTYFQDTSWTVSYKVEKGGWESYMDYKPNYYINHPEYFQSGINHSSDIEEFGLWSHLLTNKSKQVFYGKRYPWIIEYPTKNEYVSKKLEGLSLWTSAKRYFNEYDYAPDDRITFNKVMIHSDRENSGNLTLIPNTGALSQLSKYPITKTNEQEILITQDNGKWTFNYFYNRVKSNRNNIHLFTYDINQINKEVNPNAVSFYGKNVLEQMSSESFLVRLTQDKTSQYDIELKWATQREEIN